MVICWYRCPRCKNGWERHWREPILYVKGLSSFRSTCPQCDERHIKPFDSADAREVLPTQQE
jgi:hypothetical protein